MKLVFKIAAAALAALIVSAVIVLGYYGFVPGLSSIFGSDKPRDLGVKFTDNDLKSARAKTGQKRTKLPATTKPAESIKYSGKRSLDISWTDEEMTALIHNRPWKYYPVSDVQMRIGDNGSVEVSGVLRTDRLVDYMIATAVPAGTIQSVVSNIGRIPTNPPFYIQAQGKVVDNKVSIDVGEVQIGRLSVPSGWVSSYEGEIASFIEGRMRFVPGFSAKSVVFKNGRLEFDGTIPEVEATVQQ